LGVIGISLGGSEHEHSPEPFAEVYDKARQLGFCTSVHAGEVAGAESIWGAIRSLQCDRIGHGTRAEEDESLLDYLAEHQIL
jgi:adenosine deaminase